MKIKPNYNILLKTTYVNTAEAPGGHSGASAALRCVTYPVKETTMSTLIIYHTIL